MGYGTFLYQLLYFLHLSAIVIGFGSSFVYPVLSVKAKGLAPREAYVLNHATYSIATFLTSIPIAVAGAVGILLVVASDNFFQFKQTWISIAFLLFILALAVIFGLHNPNLKAMDALGEKLARGDIRPGKQGGAPKELKEFEDRASRAAMYSGLVHVLWLLLMIDMIWKPGLAA